MPRDRRKRLDPELRLIAHKLLAGEDVTLEERRAGAAALGVKFVQIDDRRTAHGETAIDRGEKTPQKMWEEMEQASNDELLKINAAKLGLRFLPYP